MAYARARQLMKVNRRCLDSLAAAALEHEILTREHLDEIFAAHELRRTLVPEDELLAEEEAKEELAPRRRFTGPGSLLPQRSQPEDPT